MFIRQLRAVGEGWGDLYISVVINEYTCIWYVSLYARFCKYTTNMLIYIAFSRKCSIHYVYSTDYMGVCSMYMHSCYIMYVHVLYFVYVYTGSKDIRKLEFNIVEIYISYSFLIVKSFVTFCTNCIFC